MKKNVFLLIAIICFFGFFPADTFGQDEFQYINLKRSSWPHIGFYENGEYVARIQGTGGRLVITSANGASNWFAVNTEDGLVSMGGPVGIGTPPDPNYKLKVGGTVYANTYHAQTPPWSDFVFEEDYKLPDLESVERYIKKHKHLLDVPSEAELKETGLNLPEMDAKLLQKIEELTLYVIELQKQINALKSEKK